MLKIHQIPNEALYPSDDLLVGLGSPDGSVPYKAKLSRLKLKIPSFTTAERDALTPANGMQIYNSTLNKVQKYENGRWVTGGLSFAGIVTDYGAVGDGVTNDTAAVAACIAANEVVIFPPGNYLLDSISMTAVNRHIIGYGKVRIIQNSVAYNVGVFNFRGEFTDITDVTSITEDNVHLEESGETWVGLTAVDKLNLGANITTKRGDVWKLACDDTHMGEYVVMGQDVTADDLMTLSGKLIYNKIPGLEYTGDMRIAKLSNYRVVIENIDFDTTAAIQAMTSAGWFCAISLRAGFGCVIRNCSFSNVPGRGIHNYSYQTRIEGCKFINLKNQPTKSRYGYGVEDGGQETIVSNCYGRNVRHLYTTNGEAITPPTNNFEYYGSAINCLVQNSIAFGCQAAGFDTHSYSWGQSFKGCRAIQSYYGASSGGHAFLFRGWEVTADDCHAVNSPVGFGLLANGMYLKNCTSTGGQAFTLGPYAVADVLALWPWIKKVRIENCEFEMLKPTSGNLFRMGTLGDATYPASDVIMRNCQFKMYGAGVGATFIDLKNISIRMENILFDATQRANNNQISAINMQDSTSNVIADRLTLDGGTLAFAANQLTLFDSAPATHTSPIRATNCVVKQTTGNAVRFTSGKALDIKGTYQLEYGTTIATSQYFTRSITAGSQVIDISPSSADVIFVKYTGSAGALALADMPAGYKQGQVVHIFNATNGTLTGTTPALSIAAGAGATIAWDGSAWRIVSAS